MIHRILFLLSIIFSCTNAEVVAETSSKVSIPDSLQDLLVMFRPLLQQLIDTYVPATVGNCAASDAPEPCQDTGDLFYLKEAFYTAKARWISGLDTAKLNEFNVGSLDDTTVGVYVDIGLDDIPMSLRIEGCIFKCFKLIDDDKSCCGQDKTIKALIAFDCSTEAPYLTNLQVQYINVFPGIWIRPAGKIDLIHVTSLIEDKLKEQIAARVTPDMILMANAYISGLLGQGDFTCKSLKGNNDERRLSFENFVASSSGTTTNPSLRN